MQTKTPNQYRDENKKQQGAGVDHTLTPGQNPVPPDDQNREGEWNKNERVDESETRYADGKDKNQKSERADIDDSEEDNEEENERENIK